MLILLLGLLLCTNRWTNFFALRLLFRLDPFRALAWTCTDPLLAELLLRPAVCPRRVPTIRPHLGRPSRSISDTQPPCWAVTRPALDQSEEALQWRLRHLVCLQAWSMVCLRRRVVLLY